MSEQAEPVRNPLSEPGHPLTGTSDMREERQETSSATYEEAERVYYTIKDEDLPPALRGGRRQQESIQAGTKTSEPPAKSPVDEHGGFSGRGPPDSIQEDRETSFGETEAAKRHETSTSAGQASPPLAGPRRHSAEIRWEGGISMQVVDL
ncbi:hypothetical protein Bbelb_370660 [Branchiostoma belcheri]|nr:hypothetical protein Bbelb_370660 [Branchiostoma belcheri]